MRALVTGASQGIGGAIARKLVAEALARGESAAITLTVRRMRQDVADLASELRAMGARAEAIAGDLSEVDTPARLVEAAVANCGGLDIVVSNAGMGVAGRLMELPNESWDPIFHINVRATWLLAKAAYRALAESRGSIVAISSMSGIEPDVRYGPYSSSKAALIMLCRQLAQELGPDGIRVNVVSPGFVRTPMTEAVYADVELAAQRSQLVPLQRIARPADVASVVAFMAGPDAGYVTGENIRVDGGLTSSVFRRLPGRMSTRE